MIEEDWNHCQIVERSLCGEREVDEQTFASLAILSERLERLKELDSAYSAVEFSPAVKKLKGRQNAVAVG